MDRRVRYEVLRTDDEDEAAQDTATPVGLQHAGMIQVPLEEPEPQPEDDYTQPPRTPPPIAQEEGAASQEGAEKYDPFLPPSYNVATTLPSYEEAERTKEEDEERRQRQLAEAGPVRDVDRFTEMQLGTDGMFLCMFLIAFVFNWVGLLASLCINHTVAGRFGAISGFGLSMVKWVLIVKHNNWVVGMAEGDSWLWWLLIILGFLLFFRGCTQYIRIKYQWHRLSAHLRNQAYFMF